MLSDQLVHGKNIDDADDEINKNIEDCFTFIVISDRVFSNLFTPISSFILDFELQLGATVSIFDFYILFDLHIPS